MVIGHHLNEKRSQMEVVISQVMGNGQEEIHMELFVLSDMTKTEARSKHAEVLGLQGNCVRNS